MRLRVRYSSRSDEHEHGCSPVGASARHGKFEGWSSHVRQINAAPTEVRQPDHFPGTNPSLIGHRRTTRGWPIVQTCFPRRAKINSDVKLWMSTICIQRDDRGVVYNYNRGDENSE